MTSASDPVREVAHVRQLALPEVPTTKSAPASLRSAPVSLRPTESRTDESRKKLSALAAQRQEKMREIFSRAPVFSFRDGKYVSVERKQHAVTAGGPDKIKHLSRAVSSIAPEGT